MNRIEAAARKLFETDTEVSRDRTQFKTFDAMPPNLQQWWKDRAERKVDELRLLAETGYDPSRDQ
jgi:hypothetical protein